MKILSKASKPWFKFQNQGSGRVRVDIYDNIGRGFFMDGFTAKGLNQKLKESGPVSEIDVHINSTGGEVFEGFAVHEILKNHEAKVNVHIDGIAASIASIIAMAGDSITISKNGFMMVHQPRGLEFGNSAKLRKTADLLDKMEDNLVATYAERTGGKEEDIRAMVREETWMTAKEAKEKGFADEIGEKVQAVAFIGDRYSAFSNMPTELVAELDINESEERKEEEMDEEKILAMINAQLSPVQAELATAKADLAASQQLITTLQSSQSNTNVATHEQNVTARVNALVASKRLIPQDRETNINLLVAVGPDKAAEVLKIMESRAPISGADRLTAEITTPSGSRESVDIDRMFTSPQGRGPTNEDMSVFAQIKDGCESQEDFRKRAYAAYGEVPPAAGLKQTWEQ